MNVTSTSLSDRNFRNLFICWFRKKKLKKVGIKQAIFPSIENKKSCIEFKDSYISCNALNEIIPVDSDGMNKVLPNKISEAIGDKKYKHNQEKDILIKNNLIEEKQSLRKLGYQLFDINSTRNLQENFWKSSLLFNDPNYFSTLSSLELNNRSSFWIYATHLENNTHFSELDLSCHHVDTIGDIIKQVLFDIALNERKEISENETEKIAQLEQLALQNKSKTNKKITNWPKKNMDSKRKIDTDIDDSQFPSEETINKIMKFQDESSIWETNKENVHIEISSKSSLVNWKVFQAKYETNKRMNRDKLQMFSMEMDQQTKPNVSLGKKHLNSIKIDSEDLPEMITNKIISCLIRRLLKKILIYNKGDIGSRTLSVIEGKILDLNERSDDVLDLGTCSIEMIKDNRIWPSDTTSNDHRTSMMKKSKEGVCKNEILENKTKGENYNKVSQKKINQKNAVSENFGVVKNKKPSKIKLTQYEIKYTPMTDELVDRLTSDLLMDNKIEIRDHSYSPSISSGSSQEPIITCYQSLSSELESQHCIEANKVNPNLGKTGLKDTHDLYMAKTDEVLASEMGQITDISKYVRRSIVGKEEFTKSKFMEDHISNKILSSYSSELSREQNIQFSVSAMKWTYGTSTGFNGKETSGKPPLQNVHKIDKPEMLNTMLKRSKETKQLMECLLNMGSLESFDNEELPPANDVKRP